MQRWTVDAASLVSFALVVAATAALPPAVAISLACCELAFAASAAVRFSAHSAPVDAAKTSSATGRKRTASAFSIRIFGVLEKSQPDASQQQQQQQQQQHHFGGFSLDRSHVVGDAVANGCSHAEQVADKLFDEREGHLDLLQGGHLLAQWFSGLAGPHQLHVSHVTQLLSYLLLPQPTAQTVPATATAGVPSTLANDARSDGTTTTNHHKNNNDDKSSEKHSTSASSSVFHVPCPRIRTWASRLMDLVHHHPQAQHAEQAQHAAPTAAATNAAAAAAPDAKLLACSTDPLVASYRPLVFYLLTEAVAAATHLALLVMGFRATATPNGTATVYTWAPSADAAAPAAEATASATAPGQKTASSGDDGDEADSSPLVFLHGIGLGLTPYLRLLSRLVAASRGRRPVYAVQYKHVSMRLTATIPAPHEVAADVAAFLVSRGVTRMSLLAHSYGTLIASALIKLAAASPSAPAVARLTLVDPVCFAMFLPHLVRNAIYQQPVAATSEPEEKPESASSRRSLLRSLIKGLVVAEFHCSVALRRRLDWARVNLWPSELPERTSVVLCGRDNLVPVREVRRILANRAALLGPSCPHPSVLFREQLGHGGFLADEDCQADVLAAALGTSRQAAQEAIAADAAAPADQTSQQPLSSAAAAAAMAPQALRRLFSRRTAAAAAAGQQLPQPAASLAETYALAAGPTIEAVEAVWSQPLGAYFLDSAALASRFSDNTNRVTSAARLSPECPDYASDGQQRPFRSPSPQPTPQQQRQQQQQIQRQRQAPGPAATSHWWLRAPPSLLPAPAQLPTFPLAAAVLVALALAGGEEDASEDRVCGTDCTGDSPSVPSLDERTRLALLAVLGAMLGGQGQTRKQQQQQDKEGSPPALSPLQNLVLRDQMRMRRRPRGSSSGGGGSSRPCVVPGAYVLDRIVRPIPAMVTPLPVVRTVRRPAASGSAGLARVLR